MKFETDKVVVERIKKIAENVVSQIGSGNSPSLDLPVRASSNVHYSKDRGLLYLGNSRSTRSFLNFAHTRK
ncbi:MAG: hypothetical protein U9P44_00625, partial [archaeon]|nr:hypothetical protein [archaeon]